MCPAQSMTLSSGTYDLPDKSPMDENPTVTLDCQSGYSGTVTFTCNSSFEWEPPREEMCSKYFEEFKIMNMYFKFIIKLIIL